MSEDEGKRALTMLALCVIVLILSVLAYNITAMSLGYEPGIGSSKK